MKKRRPQANLQNWSSLKSSRNDLAYNSIVRLLSRRDHSEKELKEKLQRRYTAEAIQIALLKAHEYGYIKETSFLAKQFSEALHRRGKGLFFINQTLKKKGLPPIARDAQRELDKCQELLDKKFNGETALSAPNRVKAYRYLTAKGFDTETIKAAIKIREKNSKILD